MPRMEEAAKQLLARAEPKSAVLSFTLNTTLEGVTAYTCDGEHPAKSVAQVTIATLGGPLMISSCGTPLKCGRRPARKTQCWATQPSLRLRNSTANSSAQRPRENTTNGIDMKLASRFLRVGLCHWKEYIVLSSRP